MPTANKNVITVIIVTALKDEYDQVRAVNAGAIDKSWKEDEGLDGRLQASRTFRMSNDNTLKILTTWATEMGEVVSSSLATTLIEKYHPQCIAMCGICAGRRGKVSLGDVIFADRLWKYDAGKFSVETDKKGNRVEKFLCDPFQYQLQDRWKQWVDNYHVEEWDWLSSRPIPIKMQTEWLLLKLRSSISPQNDPNRKKLCPDWELAIKYLRKNNFITKHGLNLTLKGKRHADELKLIYIDGVPEQKKFKIHLAPIGTGSSVVEDPDIFDRLSTSMRKVLGLEMEAFSIGAVGSLKNVPALVAKGVADYADTDKDDGFRTFAARASAECIIGFLRKSLPSLLNKTSFGSSTYGQIEQLDSNRLGRASPNLLPRDISTFTGRNKHLNTLIKRLIPSDFNHTTAISIESIHGMAGIGKTTLAIHLAHRITEYYPDAQLFIELHGFTPGQEPVDAATALERLLRALGVPASNLPDNLDERAALWRSELSNLQALIVLDNAISHEQIAPLLPGASSSCVIITSRRRLSSLEGVQVLALDVLTKKEAIKLFRRIVSGLCTKSHEPIIANIVQLCGYLPLAIQLVGNKWRHRPTWRIEDLLIQLQDTRTRLKYIRSESIDIASAFELSYKGLTKSNKLLFRRLGLHPGNDITPTTAAVLMKCEIVEAEYLLDKLFEQSLISEPKRARYTLHDLIRDYAREKVAKEESKSQQYAGKLRLLYYYLQSVNIADQILEPHRYRLPVVVSEIPLPIVTVTSHREVLQWLKDERLNILACVQLAAELGLNDFICQFAQALAHYLLTAGYNAQELHFQAREAAKAIGSKVYEANALTNLGYAFHESGKFDMALKYFGEALKIWILEDNKDGQAKTLNGIGFTLERVGQYKKALEELSNALEIRENISDKFGEAQVLNAMGAVNWRLELYKKAMKYFKKSLSIRQDIQDRYGESRTINNIGFTLQRLGEYEKAEKTLIEALTIAQDIGDKHSETVTLNNLGYTLERMGRYNEAFDYALQGLDLSRITESLYEEGRALDGMARCAEGLGDKNNAYKYWKAALKIFENVGVPEANEINGILDSYIT